LVQDLSMVVNILAVSSDSPHIWLTGVNR
jgi:hypothetical protein